jgi:hypothetical protein
LPNYLVKININNFYAKTLKMSKNLTKRAEDYSKWYNELVVKADLAENSGVRGCMVIKPYGYAIWEKMQAELDRMFKETGHSNAYFPLFVPKSMFEAEEKNAEGKVVSSETNWEMFEQFLIKLSPRGESKAALKTRFFELIDRLSDPDIQSDPVAMAELISDIQSVKAALETKKPEEKEEDENQSVNA